MQVFKVKSKPGFRKKKIYKFFSLINLLKFVVFFYYRGAI